MIHSIPAGPVAGPCHVTAGTPGPRLRGWVLSYSTFRTAAPVDHRILPINVPALVIDLTGECRVATGACAEPYLGKFSSWREGVTVGLTPAGVDALLGVPMAELTGQVVPLDDLLGRREATLAERLRSSADRFRVLDEWLGRSLPPAPRDMITDVWWRLQRGDGRRLRVPEIAAGLGIGRRTLEIAFRRKIGIPPGAVVRVARFQHALRAVAEGRRGFARTAMDLGYADQAHLSRDIRRGTGLTPSELHTFAGTVRCPQR